MKVLDCDKTHNVSNRVMVTRKWVKGSKLLPSRAQLFSRVAKEATDVCTDLRDYP